MDRETGPAIDQAAIIETKDLYPRITSRHTFVGLATPLALEFRLQDNRTASDHRDMVPNRLVPNRLDSRTTAYRQIDSLDTPLHNKEEVPTQGMPMSSQDCTSRRINRLPLRDDRTGQEQESRQEPHQATDSESTTREVGREATPATQVEIEFPKSITGRGHRSERRTQEGPVSSTDSMEDRRKEILPKIENRTTPFQGNRRLQSPLEFQDNSLRTSSHRLPTSLK